MPPSVACFLDPGLYPQAPARIELRQTHISWVFLAGDTVYKVKKPVAFPFLDFSTLERRRHFCHEEVRLNRRLAPQVYRGVVSVCPAGQGFRLGGAEDPAAVEYAVEMARLPDTDCLRHQVIEGALNPDLLDAVADLLVEFHARAEVPDSAASHGSPEAIAGILQDNFLQAAAFRGDTLDPFEDEAIQSSARRFLLREEEWLRRRQSEGRIREGHGDLHADHVYEGCPPRIVDCIEFNPRLRFCDVASDIAFLFMDLEFLGRPDLAERFLARYVDRSGDEGVRRLLPFYAGYRAYVRGKVDSLKSRQIEVPEPERQAAAESARAHFSLAYRFLWRLRPALVVMVGRSGTGKTVLAETLARRTGFRHLNSDVVRKQLAGLPLTARGGRELGLYAPEMSARTYASLRQQAAEALARGEGVVLDATHPRRQERETALAVATAAGLPALLVACECPEATVRERLQRRVERDDSPSDADWEVYRLQGLAYEPLDPAEPGIVVDASGDPGLVARQVEAELLTRT